VVAFKKKYKKSKHNIMEHEIISKSMEYSEMGINEDLIDDFKSTFILYNY